MLDTLCHIIILGTSLDICQTCIIMYVLFSVRCCTVVLQWLFSESVFIQIPSAIHTNKKFCNIICIFLVCTCFSSGGVKC